MTENQVTTGMDLKVQRIRARLTQHQLGKAIGWSRVWVAKVEAQDAPSARTQARYLEGLAVARRELEADAA